MVYCWRHATGLYLGRQVSAFCGTKCFVIFRGKNAYGRLPHFTGWCSSEDRGQRRYAASSHGILTACSCGSEHRLLTHASSLFLCVSVRAYGDGPRRADQQPLSCSERALGNHVVPPNARAYTFSEVVRMAASRASMEDNPWPYL